MKQKKTSTNKNRHPSRTAGNMSQPAAVSTLASWSFSRLGKKVSISGAICAAVGYYVLTLADPMGQNFFSKLSPFLILGGYALMGIGIIIKDPQESDTTPIHP